MVGGNLDGDHLAQILCQDGEEEEVAMKIIARLARPMHIDQPVLNVLSETIERDFLAPMRASP